MRPLTSSALMHRYSSPCPLSSIERFHPTNRRHLAKLLGLAVCVSGAVTMAVFQGPVIVGREDSAAARVLESLTALPPGMHEVSSGL